VVYWLDNLGVAEWPRIDTLFYSPIISNGSLNIMGGNNKH